MSPLEQRMKMFQLGSTEDLQTFGHSRHQQGMVRHQHQFLLVLSQLPLEYNSGHRRKVLLEPSKRHLGSTYRANKMSLLNYPQGRSYLSCTALLEMDRLASCSLHFHCSNNLLNKSLLGLKGPSRCNTDPEDKPCTPLLSQDISFCCKSQQGI
jgi:hypothetical protein